MVKSRQASKEDPPACAACTRPAPDRAPKLLLAMTAARHRKASFRIWPARLSELDERALRTGLGPAALCVALVGYLPELQAEEYELTR